MKGAQAIANGVDYCIPCTPVQILKTIAAAATAEKLSATQKYFRQAILVAKKDLAGTDNTGAVYLGRSSAANEQPIVIQPGGSYVLEPPNGAKFDLSDWYLDADTNDDGVVILYC